MMGITNQVHAEWRLLLLDAQGYRCTRCNTRISRHFATLDHTIPRAMGGPDALGNVTAMCWGCNNRKHDSKPNGCDMIWLLAVNSRLGVEPTRW